VEELCEMLSIGKNAAYWKQDWIWIMFPNAWDMQASPLRQRHIHILHRNAIKMLKGSLKKLYK
jgi:hypothetical protein